ncbi:MAG TPA: NUDIX hydrolase [Stellaceae bacterium]|nr:NUDIX hydrolase [Stellaceae bacterium]
MTAVVALPAATLLLLRDGSAGLEVLMLERHRDAFFSSAMVFPGGRVDPEDGAPASLARCRAVPGVDEAAMAYRIAAIRESYEEAGMLVARRPDAAGLVADGDFAREDFASLLAGGAIELATDLLVPFSHWVTPERSPKRYDTRFFLARAPADQAPKADGYEAVELLWLAPLAALAEAEAGRRRLVFATRLNLMRLAASADVAGALAAAASAPASVPICPEMYDTPTGPRIRIPEGLGYDICDFPTADPRHG